MKKLTRRQLLVRTGQGLALGGLSSLFPGLCLFPRTAKAEVGSGDHFFVLLRTFGGMDCTLGLDPWVMPSGADEQDMYIEYRPDDIKVVKGLKLGPAASSLAAHADSVLIVNGIQMRRDAGHDVDNLYSASGAGDGKSATVPIELALALGTGPFGVVASGQPYLAGKAVSLSTTQDLQQANAEGSLIDFIQQRMQLQLEEAGTAWEKAQADLLRGKDATTKFISMLNTFQAQGAVSAEQVVAAAFASGGACQAQIDVPIDGGPLALDTHINHPGNHIKVQTKVWDYVASVIQLFKSLPYAQGSLYDATTFMVMTEFSRTPALNVAKGKDHNPFTNSFLLAGRGINGGTVVGASKLITRKQTGTGMPNHIAWPFNYTTGQLATEPQGASFFFPENVVQTVSKLFGSPAGFAAVPAGTPVIPGIVKG